ncbi:MAG UNVERIFIED_CONTAM: hypothetical protein LVR18_18195 [Planctomycetaceae bacterium]
MRQPGLHVTITTPAANPLPRSLCSETNMPVPSRLLPLTLALLVSTALLTIPSPTCRAAQDETDFFETQIRPLLVEHCVTCHGPPPGRQSAARFQSRSAERR